MSAMRGHSGQDGRDQDPGRFQRLHKGRCQDRARLPGRSSLLRHRRRSGPLGLR
jgi:hypothetical protein